MRILKVRFKNLNSLAGEWEVDFTLPAVAADGIVAITGPTGAGKSTILDAICLALYGRTPRLAKINMSGNEIISRRTSECFAEASFSAGGAAYRCHWSQRRAFGKADGQLQQPKHELSGLESGEILASGIKGVGPQVETLTGLDFDRFTRTMFLAQGSFASFLLADPDERAPILEQITGTEIYSAISRRVHEQYAAERKRLDEMRARLSGIRLLEPEEEAALRAALTTAEERALALEAAITDRQTLAEELEGIHRLSADVRRLTEAATAQQERILAFAPERARLDRAMRALECAGEYAALQTLRHSRQEEERELRGLTVALPLAVEALSAAAARFTAQEQAVSAARQEQAAQTPILQQAREMDVRLRERAAPLETAAAALRQEEAALERLGRELAATRGQREQRRAALEALDAQLAATAGDAALFDQLAAIQNRLEEYALLLQALSDKRTEGDKAKARREELTTLTRQQREALARTVAERDRGEQSLKDKRQALGDLLEGAALVDWNTRLLALGEEKRLLEEATAASASLRTVETDLARLEETLRSLSGRLPVLEVQVAERGESLRLLELARDGLERRVSEGQRIRSLDEERARLADGEPCPLCGALHHPYAQGNIPRLDDSAQELAGLREALKKAAKALKDSEMEHAALLREQKAVAESLVKQGQFRQAAVDRLGAALTALGLDPTAADIPTLLAARQEANAPALRQCREVTQAATLLEKETADLDAALRRIREAAVAGESALTRLAAEEAGQEREAARLVEEWRDLDRRALSRREALADELAVYGVTDLAEGALPGIGPLLAHRRDKRRTMQDQREELVRLLVSLTALSEQQALREQAEAEALTRRREAHALLAQERESLRRERLALFGDKDPTQEGQRLAEILERAERDREQAREAQAAAQSALAAAREKIAGLEQSLRSRSVLLAEKEQRFLDAIADKGFPDEASFAPALLPEEERNALGRAAEALQQEQALIHKRREDADRRLAEELGRESLREGLERLAGVAASVDAPWPLPEQAAPALLAQAKDSLAGLGEERKALFHELGAMRQRLQANAEARERQADQALAIEAQKRECDRWDALNALIGSHDGKKYRNFAQGLTFALLIAHANQQLQKMSDRYLLVSDPRQVLELSVMDKYQAGEVRTAKNLSGGESFLVSLALALGLSRMAGHKARVDALFLDEGFGSLDEDALDVALETLAGLKREDDKLIVVISHVPALKERISAQIRVTPLSGGRSRIDGPGR